MGVQLQDTDVWSLKKKLDENHDDGVSVEEFVNIAGLLSSRSEMKQKVPLPSTVGVEDKHKTFIQCTIENVPGKASFASTQVSVGRLELQIASFPLRNAVDWINLCKRAQPDSNKGEPKKPDEGAKAIKKNPDDHPGIVALRASFECDSEDIFVPPTTSSVLRFDMEQFEVVVHDLLIGEAAFYFRAGPLKFATSTLRPYSDAQPYETNMQIVLCARILYAGSKLDMDWDLEDVLTETTGTFSRKQIMPRDLSGMVQEDVLAVSNKQILFQLSLKQVLFLQAFQKLLTDLVEHGNALCSVRLDPPEPVPPNAHAQPLSGGSPRSWRSPEKHRERAPGLDAGANSVSLEKRKVRNIKQLTRSFSCPKLILRLVDDLQDTANNVLQTLPIKLLEFMMSDIQILEKVSRCISEAEVIASTTIRIDSESMHDTKTMETLVEPWKFDLEIRTSIEKELQRITFTAQEYLEFTATPDHIQRPISTLRKFEQHQKDQEKFMSTTLQYKMAKGFKQLDRNINIVHKLSSAIADFNIGAKRKFRNSTNLFIYCRVCGMHDDVDKKPILELELRPGACISIPRSVLETGVLQLQPARGWTIEEQQQALLEKGGWSKPADLSLPAVAVTKITDSPYMCKLMLIIHVPMPEQRAKSILTLEGPQDAFKMHFEMAIRAGREQVQKVVVRQLKSGGPGGVLSIDFAVALACEEIMGGLLLDMVAADFSQHRLSLSFVASGLIEPDTEIVVVKEPLFERSTDCSSAQLPGTFLFVSRCHNCTSKVGTFVLVKQVQKNKH
jgi:hypothetical protein